jgi:peptidoglycan/xylan/chitin deacetylase (PgdA/CDA1 family)
MVTVIQAWDDGVVEDVRLVALLRKLGARAAFNLNPGWYQSGRSFGWMDGDHPVYRLGREEIPEVFAGFEVAAHSVTHPRLTQRNCLRAWLG